MALARGVILQTLGRHISWTAQQGMLGAVAASSSRPLSASLQAFSTQAEPGKENQQQQQQQQQQQGAGSQPEASAEQSQADHAGTSGSKSAGPQGEASSSGGDTSSSSSSSSSSGSDTSTSGQEGASSSQSSSSGADPRVEDMTQRMFKTFRSGYQNMRTKVESVSKGSSDGSQDRRLLKEAAKEMQAVFRTGDHIRSATRMYTGPLAVMPEGDGAGGPSELVLSKRRPTTWQKIHEKLSGLPLFSKLGSVKETAAYKKSRDVVEDMKERYETTDHPAVHKLDDLKDRLVSGSEGSRAMREIRTRDPSFDMNNFVRSVKLDAPVVSKAFLNHDLATLKLHCGPELLERFAGIFKHFSEAGLFEDPTILFVGDVEVVEIKLLDDDPFAIVQFHCQQLKCTRDKFGNVIEGATDSIQRVYYFWGLQQEKQGVVTAEGQLLPPRWVIKDMMWQSMLALV